MTEELHEEFTVWDFEQLKSGTVRSVLTLGMNCFGEDDPDMADDYKDLLELVSPDVLELPLNETQINYTRFVLGSDDSSVVLQVATYLNSLRKEKQSSRAVEGISQETRNEIITDTNS
jgi:hypothetical protein